MKSILPRTRIKMPTLYSVIQVLQPFTLDGSSKRLYDTVFRISALYSVIHLQWRTLVHHALEMASMFTLCTYFCTMSKRLHSYDFVLSCWSTYVVTIDSCLWLLKLWVLLMAFCLDINECESNPCSFGATCQDEVNEYHCICAPGYNYTHCENGMELLIFLKSKSWS